MAGVESFIAGGPDGWVGRRLAESHFDLRPELDHAVGWQAEEEARTGGIPRHPDEERLTPWLHDVLPRRHERLAARK